MSKDNSNVQSRQWISRLDRVDPKELKEIKVSLKRKLPDVGSISSTVHRSIDNPTKLNEAIHYRRDEGLRPIFNRSDIIVNDDEKREVSGKSGRSSKDEPTSSRARDGFRDSREYPEPQKNRRSHSPYSRPPGPSRRHNSRSPPREKSTDYYRDRDDSYVGHKRRAVSPPLRDDRGASGRYGSRSPPKYKSSSGKPRSRTPPKDPSRDGRRRSRSRSPYRTRRSRSRDRHYSRSPHREPSDYRRYERRRSHTPGARRGYSPDRRRRSRSPRPSRTSRPRGPPEFPGYFEGEEFWIPTPLAPRFIPRGFMPPAAFPRVPGPGILYPRMPMIIPHNFPGPMALERPPLPVYNSRKILKLPTASASATPATTEATSTTVATTAPSADVQTVPPQESNAEVSAGTAETPRKTDENESHEKESSS